MAIKNNDIVLFQGDSITDTGRDRSDGTSMGTGYAMMAAAMFSSENPDMDVKFINRGIGGNRTADLKARWNEDCISLKPSIVSIMIGINDCWRRYDNNDPTAIDDFYANYRNILERTKENTNAKVILCEPFVLPVPEDRKKWREDLNPKIDIVRELAREFNALLLPLDGILNSVSTRKKPEFWAADGVHPTFAGHALIAKKWLEFSRYL